MPIIAPRPVHYARLDKRIKTAAKKLAPQAVDVSYEVREDSTGDPSIFFSIVLTDDAAREESLVNVAPRIRTALTNELRPVENWGLYPYFNFHSHSEQMRIDGVPR